MKKKLIVICEKEISITRFHEMGVDYLQSHGWEIAIWCIWEWIIEDEYKCYDRKYDDCEVKYFSSLLQYEKEVSIFANECVFFLPSVYMESAIYYPLCKYNCYYIVDGNRGEIPVNPLYNPRNFISEKKNILRAIKRWYNQNKHDLLAYPYKKIKRIVISRRNRQYKNLHNQYLTEYFPPQAVFVTNEFAKEAMFKDGNERLRKSNIIYSPSNAYNYYLEEEQKGASVEENIILFAVGGLGFKVKGLLDVDYQLEIYKPKERARYMKQIETLLDNLERYYGLPVVVAGHPRGEYAANDFGGRKVICGQTCAIAKKCKIAVETPSTSNVYPILYDKPMLLIYNNTFMRSLRWKFEYVPLMQALSINGLNLDCKEMIEQPWNYIETVTPDKKDEFIHKYHNVLSDKKPFGELLYNYLENKME